SQTRVLKHNPSLEKYIRPLLCTVVFIKSV
ncbi:hypothetical protein TSAR_008053, partial [Trichomalopsis sarcophagae]